MLRAIRGATTVETNDATAILEATAELLRELRRQNDLQLEDIASALFTVTEDLDSAFPAAAARDMGWTLVPMMCAREIPVPGGLPRCIRVMIHVNTLRSQAEIRHVYLRRAVALRPDWSGAQA